jgi:hypothetical protein
VLGYGLLLVPQILVMEAQPWDNGYEWRTMTNSEPNVLLELWEMNLCPQCGKEIPERTRVGSGRKSEGGFCSLDCFADFYQADMAERFRRAVSLATQRRN